MKKIFIKISKIGFILCGLAMLAFVLIIQLQKKEIMVIPETVGTLFFIILCIATIAFAIAFIMDLVEGIKTNGWFLVLRNIGILISTVFVVYLWETHLLTKQMKIWPWLCKTIIVVCVVEVFLYLNRKKKCKK